MERIEIAFEMLRKLHEEETDDLIRRELLEALSHVIPARYKIRMREQSKERGVA
jgi:hypothetical protein